MTLLLVALGAALAGALILLLVYFVWGLRLIASRRSDAPAMAGAGQAAGQAMSPLGGIARLYVVYFLLAVAFLAWRLKDGFYGNGPNGEACVATGITGAPVQVAREWRTRPGSSLGGNGDLQACVAHPTAGQWALYALTALPWLLLWLGVLLMIMRLVRHAAEHGPFTPTAASLMVRLGWLIIAGCVVAGSLTTLGSELLTDLVVLPRPWDPGGVAFDAAVGGPLRALLPLPALAGVALLSFGRITRAGAEMNEELRATV